VVYISLTISLAVVEIAPSPSNRSVLKIAAGIRWLFWSSSPRRQSLHLPNGINPLSDGDFMEKGNLQTSNMPTQSYQAHSHVTFIRFFTNSVCFRYAKTKVMNSSSTRMIAWNRSSNGQWMLNVSNNFSKSKRRNKEHRVR